MKTFRVIKTIHFKVVIKADDIRDAEDMAFDAIMEKPIDYVLDEEEADVEVEPRPDGPEE